MFNMEEPQVPNLKVCRTCFQSVNSTECVQLNDGCCLPNFVSVREMLICVMPEMNLKAVMDPVICLTCLVVLKESFKFRRNFLDNETRLIQLMKTKKLKTVLLKDWGESIKSSSSCSQANQRGVDEKAKEFFRETALNQVLPSNQDIEELNYNYEKNYLDALMELKIRTDNKDTGDYHKPIKFLGQEEIVTDVNCFVKDAGSLLPASFGDSSHAGCE